MDLDLVLRLETKIDYLLHRKNELEEECRRLRDERQSFLEERENFRSQLDRILSKLDHLDLESS